MKRSPLKRTRFRPKTSTAAKRKGYALSWNVAMERAGQRCEFIDGDQCEARAEHCHHVQPRSRGGSDDHTNLLAVCARHHEWIHAHPAESTVRGYLKSRYEGSAA